MSYCFMRYYDREQEVYDSMFAFPASVLSLDLIFVALH